MPPSLDKIAQDLSWILNQAPLVATASEFQEVKVASFSQQQLVTMATHVHSSLPAKLPLGHYFERLWHAVIEYSKDLSICYKNQQIYSDGRTIGEFDILLYNVQAKVYEHWELAVKFYLAINDNWLGPNINDSFAAKTSRLCEQQIQLAETNAARAWLADKGMRVTTKRIVTRGILFYSDHKQAACSLATEQHLRGLWYVIDDFLRTFSYQKQWQWRMLSKLEWLTVEQECLYKSAEQISSSFIDADLDTVQLEGVCGEKRQRCFLVSSHWLERARELSLLA